MSWQLRGARTAYVLHAALSVLVIGLLSWATVASLRLESAAQTEVQRGAQREFEKTVQLALYQMEQLAQSMLAGEMSRNPADYRAISYPTSEEVRLQTGEMLRTGALVRISPLLLQPPRHNWIVLYFQASPRTGYDSPLLVPEHARRWLDFAEGYERNLYATRLARLAYTYTVDELARQYEEAGGDTLGVLEDGLTRNVRTAALAAGQGAGSGYTRRRQAIELFTKIQTPEADCAPQQVAAAEVHAQTELAEQVDDNVLTPADDEVGITYQPMVPVWLKLRPEPRRDLAFIRAISTDGETAFQGFVVDWAACRAALLAAVADHFPEGELKIVDPPLAPEQITPDENMLSMIPARFDPHAEPPPASATQWSTTHSFLLIGWSASLLLLGAGALGIRSLISLSERRSQFAYAVTHELRTPLTTFRLYTDMLAQGLVPPDDQQEYLETLNAESSRLSSLVSGVLEYSRVESNSVPINREHVAVSALLETVRERFEGPCGAAGVTLEIAPPPPEKLTTDPHHVVQIIGNLVDNACKYGRGAEGPRVRVSARREGGMMQFDVVDNGPGIPQRLRTAVFQPYRRGDTESTPATGGIGLGLALSRSWARLLGGYLELLPASTEGTGAHFRISLPAG